MPSIPVANTGKRLLFLPLNQSRPVQVRHKHVHLCSPDPYRCAVVVFTDLSLDNGLVSVQRSLVSSTGFYLLVELSGNPGTTLQVSLNPALNKSQLLSFCIYFETDVVIGIAVGATLGIFFILFLILMGFIIYWRRYAANTPNV